jgi:hypothetical protein
MSNLLFMAAIAIWAYYMVYLAIFKNDDDKKEK